MAYSEDFKTELVDIAGELDRRGLRDEADFVTNTIIANVSASNGMSRSAAPMEVDDDPDPEDLMELANRLDEIGDLERADKITAAAQRIYMRRMAQGPMAPTAPTTTPATPASPSAPAYSYQKEWQIDPRTQMPVPLPGETSGAYWKRVSVIPEYKQRAHELNPTAWGRGNEMLGVYKGLGGGTKQNAAVMPGAAPTQNYGQLDQQIEAARQQLIKLQQTKQQMLQQNKGYTGEDAYSQMMKPIQQQTMPTK